MTDIASGRLYFDYVDPVSYLLEVELREAENVLRRRVDRVPFELRAPPAPMIDPDAPEWRRRWEAALRIGVARGASPGNRPRLVPWTRKAHELVMFAREHDLGYHAHTLLFERVFERGVDIGRIDILVAMAVELGLDETETKATLDVDRFAPSVAEARQRAMADGVTAPPTLAFGGRILEGFRNTEEIVRFLDSS